MSRTLYSVSQPPAPVVFAATNALITDAGQTAHTTCVGSACMMWRWLPKVVNVSTRQNEDIWVPTREPSEHGYCGIAGKPVV